MFKIIAHYNHMNFYVHLCFSIDMILPFFLKKKKAFGAVPRQKETQQHNQGSAWFLDTLQTCAERGESTEDLLQR